MSAKCHTVLIHVGVMASCRGRKGWSVGGPGNPISSCCCSSVDCRISLMKELVFISSRSSCILSSSCSYQGCLTPEPRCWSGPYRASHGKLRA